MDGWHQNFLVSATLQEPPLHIVAEDKQNEALEIEEDTEDTKRY